MRTYYQQFEEQQTQILLDQRIKEHIGQAAAFQQVGGAYNQHLISLQGQRPRLPLLPTPMLPMNSPLVPGYRPPVFQRPPGPLGYASPPMMPAMVTPPGAPSLPAQITGNVSTTVPGSVPTPTSNAPLSMGMATPVMYQPNPATPNSQGFESFNINAQAHEAKSLV